MGRKILQFRRYTGGIAVLKLRGTRYATFESLCLAVRNALKNRFPDGFGRLFQQSVVRQERCVTHNGEYFEHLYWHNWWIQPCFNSIVQVWSRNHSRFLMLTQNIFSAKHGLFWGAPTSRFTCYYNNHKYGFVIEYKIKVGKINNQLHFL